MLLPPAFTYAIKGRSGMTFDSIYLGVKCVDTFGCWLLGYTGKDEWNGTLGAAGYKEDWYGTKIKENQINRRKTI
jgi:hypothetical protein